MNEHLKPVFQLILPELEKDHIDYWVFGGISIAAFAGKFIRDNQDVDVFVREVDFENAESILGRLCKKNDFILKYHSQASEERPKMEIKIDNVERFSMIPMYQKNNIITFKYRDGNQEYSNKIEEKTERNISDFMFFTTRDKFIKEMFINHIKARPDKKKRGKIIKDAKAILNSEEWTSLGFSSD